MNSETANAYRSQGSIIEKVPEVGIKHDDGKPRWDLLPLGPLELAVRAMTFKLKDYPKDNWQKVEDPENRFYSAMMCHIAAYNCGEIFDPETGLPHLAHALANLIFLLWHTS